MRNADDPHQFEGEPPRASGGATRPRVGPAARRRRERARSNSLPAHTTCGAGWCRRSDYPDGRNGYLRWRRDQKKRHADELTAILVNAGVDEATVERAALIVAKIGLGTDPEVQRFEDAVCLTFLHTQLSSTADRIGDDRIGARHCKDRRQDERPRAFGGVQSPIRRPHRVARRTRDWLRSTATEPVACQPSPYQRLFGEGWVRHDASVSVRRSQSRPLITLNWRICCR